MKVLNCKRKDVIRLDAEDMTFFTKEGYLIDHPVVTRVGIFEYHNPDGSVRKEFRPPEEVFNEDSLASYVGKPVIITHDAGYVNKDNASDEEIGTILDKGYQDGDNVRAKIVIHDTDAMKESGLKELSLGYNLDLDETPGEYEGEKYDAVQRNIRINHLALVAEARAGDKARLNIDGKDHIGGKQMRHYDASEPMSAEEFDKKLRALAQNGEESEAEKNTDGDDETEEQTIAEKIQAIRDRRDRRDADEDPEDLESATKMIKDQDSDIQTLLDALDSMEAEKDLTKGTPAREEDEDDEVSDDEPLNKDSVDRIVGEKLRVLRIGDKLNMDGLEGKNVLAMKKAIVKKVSPKINFDGKSKSYINAAFDYAVENIINIKKDASFQRRQMLGSLNMDSRESGLTMAQEARERMLAHERGEN